MKHLLIKILFYISFISISFAGVIHVPSSQTTIQAGINSANDGDTVLVSVGLYFENINFKGKAITVASTFLVNHDTSLISNTIINGSQPSHQDSGSVVTFGCGEDTNSVLCGFTITEGTGTKNLTWYDREGGGIYFAMAGGKAIHNKIINNTCNYGAIFGVGITADAGGNHIIVIENNIIHSNVGTALTAKWCSGAGIGAWTPSGKVHIRNNKIYNNHLYSSYDMRGAGINFNYEYHTSLDAGSIVGNFIYDNECHPSAASEDNTGAGICIKNIDLDIRNNVISNNVYHSHGKGGGIYLLNSDSKIHNNIISKNQAPAGGGIYLEDSATEPIIINNTLVSNIGVNVCDGLYIFESNPFVMNTIIWGDSAISSSEQIYISPGYILNIFYSDFDPSKVTGNWSGIENINSDPLLLDSIIYQLSDNSPCIGSGKDSIEFNGIWYVIPKTCFLGHTRPSPSGSDPDIGACESPRAHPTGIHQSKGNMTNLYQLSQNYPNPFNPNTIIEFSIPKASKVTLEVFNIVGENVSTLVSDRLPVGSYSYEWDASKLASGVYLYQLRTRDFVETKKMVLLK